GLEIFATHQTTSGTPLRLPSFQNLYGQGLDGQFEFFDGRGGGVNDGVDQSWGPVMDGRPLAQASLTQAGQGDVRYWQPHPDNVRGYFQSATTSTTDVAVEGAGDLGSIRLALGERDAHGLTPASSLYRDDAALSGVFRPLASLRVSGSFSAAETKYGDSPGTGFDEGNPVAEFTRMGRQVDVAALRDHLRDSTGAQINWIYTDQNNPFFGALLNDNHSDRTHVSAGGSATYALNPWLSATAADGTDYYTQSRFFSVASAWVGGFPFYAAPGDFSKGGFEDDEVGQQVTTSGVHFDAVRGLGDGPQLKLTLGGDARIEKTQIRSAGVDSVVDVPSVGAPAGALTPNPTRWLAHAQTNAAYGTAALGNARGDITASLRSEWASVLPGQHVSTLYPAFSGAWDLGVPSAAAASNSAPSGAPRPVAATLRAEWSRSGDDLSPYSVETIYGGAAPTGSIAPSAAQRLSLGSDLQPEITDTWQAGADLGFLAGRLGVGLTYYHEQTSNVILPIPSADTTSQLAVLRNAGTVSNRGIEATLAVKVVTDPDGFGWEITANAAKNQNRVDQIAGGATALPLGPSMWGLSVQARPGMAIGALVGERYLRDSATHALVLRNGLPLPDSAAGAQVVGAGLPDWIWGATNTFRYRWFSLSILVDGHVGGQVFSATNLWGGYSGTLAATAYRPDSGLLIAGIDAATGKPNTQHVTTQDYYHALGAIPEAWVYSATFAKLREVRLTFALPTHYWNDVLPFQSLRASLVARNLALWAKAPNIDPEAAFGSTPFYGVEMGQLPAVKSIGLQLSITP
ncbi:MAG TPA: hypothetical protein VMH39_11345, partial [Gemmatimonadaceae bacterium]|nr:hypothetical protein [Gemmatimonadaceae bacterium]